MVYWGAEWTLSGGWRPAAGRQAFGVSMQILERSLAAGETTRAEDTRYDWRAWLRSPWFWGVVALAALIVWWVDVPHLKQTISRDEGAFFVIAQGILHGHLPYRDFFDHKPPGLYYLLAPVLAITSPFSVSQQIVAVRAVALLANLATAAGLVVLGTRWKRLEVGILAAGLWLTVLPIYEGALVQTEPFSTTAVVWAFVIASGRPGWRTALGAGLLATLSGLFKQTAILAVPGVALVLYAGLLPRGRWFPPLRTLLGAAGAFAAGLVAPWLLVVGFFAAQAGLQPFLNQVIIANFHYPPDPLKVTWKLVQGAFYSMPLAFVLPVIYALVLGVIALRAPSRLRERLNFGLVAAAMTALLNLAPFASHGYYHYWLQILPWTLLLCGAAIVDLLVVARPALTAVGQESDAPLRAAVLPFIMVGLLGFAGSGGRPDISAQYDRQIEGGNWIRQSVPSDARLLVAPAQPEYYFLSGHQPVTDYIYILPVNQSPALLARVNDQISSGAFDYVVWQTNPGMPYYEPQFQDTYGLLNQRYHVVSTDDQLGLILYAINR